MSIRIRRRRLALLLVKSLLPDESFDDVFVVGHQFTVICHVGHEEGIQYIPHKVKTVDNDKHCDDRFVVEICTILKRKPGQSNAGTGKV